MASTICDTRVMGAEAAVGQIEVSDATRVARCCALEETVGLVFGLMTVVYIVLSLSGLAF